MVKDCDLVPNPLDLIERIVSSHEWPFDRYTRDEMNVGVEGCWSRYHLWFAWRDKQQTLQFSCAFDLKVPQDKLVDTHSLLAVMNEQLWLGHFDVWPDEGMLMFRHTLLFGGGMKATPEQIEQLVDIALRECERFYPAVHFMMWGGKSPNEAIAAAMLETEGEA